MPRERTHWEGCWRERTHHDCALVRIAALEAELAEMSATTIAPAPPLPLPTKTSISDTDALIAYALSHGTPDCQHHWTTTSACPLCLRGRIVRLCEALASMEAELAAERERRKAAEALLHDYSRLANAAMFDANRSGYEYDRKGEMVDISAHFARYKD